MTPDFFQVFAKNSLMKSIFEEEKKFDSRRGFFFWKIVPNWMYFGQGEDLTRRGVNHETVRKSAIFPQPGSQNRLKRSNSAYVNK